MEFAEIKHYFGFSGAPKKEPPGRFSIFGHMVAYGSNAPQTSTVCRSRTVIKSVLWLVSEIWSFQVWGWCGVPELSLHSVYMQWQQTMFKLGANQNAWFTWRKVPCQRV